MDAARNSFSFFVSYIEAVEELPEKEQLATLKAIIKYALYDKEPENFKGIKQAVFLLVKPTLDKSKQKAANGKQKGSKRKANESKPEANGKHNSILPSIGIGEGEGIGEGIGIGEGEGEAIPRSDGSLFTSFWYAYPETAKRKREDAWNAWVNLNPSPEQAASIMKHLDAWKKSQRWLDDNGAYIPNAENFLDPDRGYMRNKPLPAKKKECDWTPGQRPLDAEEIEAIHRLLNKPLPEIDLPDEYESEVEINAD